MHIFQECKREYDNAWYQGHKEDQRQIAKDNLHERRKVARGFVFAYLGDYVCEVCAEYRPGPWPGRRLSGLSTNISLTNISLTKSALTAERMTLRC